MVNYPLLFAVESSLSAGMGSTWISSGSVAQSITVAIPPEFEGPGGGFSPEDLYALALVNCFGATFKVIAEKSRLAFESLKLSGELTVDRDEAGKPWMKHFALRAELMGTPDADRARRLLEKTSESCMILNSVKTEKSFEFLVGA